MLILHYQRLLLISLFLSGQSDHPLLAIHISSAMSKPLHPHIPLYYTILNYFYQYEKSRNIIIQFTYNNLGDLLWMKILFQQTCCILLSF